MTEFGSDLILARLEKLHPKSIDLSLGRIERLLARLGHPERRLPPVVHIAGTNGKGSTLAMLDAMLVAAGHRVHRYISPHLVRFNERILLHGTPIAEPLLADGVRCHGGFDADGNYISPRTLHRAPAIESWEAQRVAQFGTPKLDAPLEQFSVNLESFALELDDPADMYHDQRGTLVPFGFELDFTTDRAAYLWPPIQTRMEIPCKVHGQVMVGSDTIDIDAWGQRDHSWGGPRDWWMMGWMWSAGRLDDGTRFHAVVGFHEPGGGVSDGTFGIAYLLDPDASSSTEFEEFDEVRVSAVFGHEGLADSATIEFGGLTLDVEPIAWAPVLLVHDDGREARFPRALARFTARDGRRGHGWIEFNQPPTT